jgi:hypothetical protein
MKRPTGKQALQMVFFLCVIMAALGYGVYLYAAHLETTSFSYLSKFWKEYLVCLALIAWAHEALRRLTSLSTTTSTGEKLLED